MAHRGVIILLGQEMTETISTIVGSILASTAVCGAVGWLLRTWISERLKGAIKNEYDLKLETFKAELKANSDVQIERLKARLQIAASERTVQFSHIYAKTAETIAEVYSHLVAFRDAVASYTSIIEYSTGPPKEERRMTVGAKFKEFQDYYKPRRIYLPRDLDDKIAEFANGLFKISIEFRRGVEEGGDCRPGAPEDKDTWMEAHKYVNEQSVELLKSLEKEFQRELGISRSLANHEAEQGVDDRLPARSESEAK